MEDEGFELAVSGKPGYLIFVTRFGEEHTELTGLVPMKGNLFQHVCLNLPLKTIVAAFLGFGLAVARAEASLACLLNLLDPLSLSCSLHHEGI